MLGARSSFPTSQRLLALKAVASRSLYKDAIQKEHSGVVCDLRSDTGNTVC